MDKKIVLDEINKTLTVNGEILPLKTIENEAMIFESSIKMDLKKSYIYSNLEAILDFLEYLLISLTPLMVHFKNDEATKALYSLVKDNYNDAIKERKNMMKDVIFTPLGITQEDCKKAMIDVGINKTNANYIFIHDKKNEEENTNVE